jgi:hypothetical protein
MPPKKSKLPKQITDIPAGKVGEVVQSFVDEDGVKEMDVTQQTDGTFTVTPTK